jgi:metal-responsive CopG/Arc/MetJ family transcriptional regulator
MLNLYIINTFADAHNIFNIDCGGIIMEDKSIFMMGVVLEKRNVEAPEVQKVFTKYGDCILSRLGIHDCADPNGLITLNVRGTDEYVKRFEDELTSIKGVSAKHMMLK